MLSLSIHNVIADQRYLS